MQHGNYTVWVHEDEELQVISVGQEPWFVVSDIDRIIGVVDVDQFKDIAKEKMEKFAAKRAKIVDDNNSEKIESVLNLAGALTLFEFGAKNAKGKSKRGQCSIFKEICKSVVPAFLANPPKDFAKA